MRSQNAGLGLKGSSYGASSSDSYRDKLKKLVCLHLLFNLLKVVSSGVILGCFTAFSFLLLLQWKTLD